MHIVDCIVIIYFSGVLRFPFWGWFFNIIYLLWIRISIHPGFNLSSTLSQCRNQFTEVVGALRFVWIPKDFGSMLLPPPVGNGDLFVGWLSHLRRCRKVDRILVRLDAS